MASQEFTLKSNNNSRYQWITGIFGMMMHTHQFVQNNAFAAGTATPTDNITPNQSLAIYHQSSYNLWRGLSAAAGLRFDYEHAKSDYHREKLNLGTGATSPLAAPIIPKPNATPAKAMVNGHTHRHPLIVVAMSINR